MERVSTWSNPAKCAHCVATSYRRDFWDQQPRLVMDHYAVGFRVMHGFTSATTVYDVAENNDGRDLIALYVGDSDPGGLFMSECDLPQRLAEYGGDHVSLMRIALLPERVGGLPSFPVSDKRKDPRRLWFVRNYGANCWEIDTMDPPTLGGCVKQAIDQ